MKQLIFLCMASAICFLRIWALELTQPLQGLVTRMRTNDRDAMLQRGGCNTLRNAVLTSSDQNKVTTYGVDLDVIKAMQLFPGDMELQMACMTALARFVQSNRYTGKIIGMHGAIEMMATAVKNFPNNIEMQRLTRYLGSFTDPHVNNIALPKTGVTSVVLDGLKKFDNDGAVMLSGLSYLAHVCTSPRLNLEISTTDYLDRSVQLMRLHAHIPIGIRGEVILINNQCFSSNVKHRHILAEAGFINDVVQTMRDANRGETTDVAGNDHMFNNAVRMLYTYSDNEKYRLEMERVGLVWEIQHLVLRLPPGQLKYTSCKLLATLVSQSDPNLKLCKQ